MIRTSDEYSIRQKVYPIKTLKNDVCIDWSVPDHYHQNYIESTWQFYWGESTTISSTTERNEYTRINIPDANLLNWFKYLIILFEPTLNFGWIQPSFKLLKIPQKITTNNTSVNVIPLEEYNPSNYQTFLDYGSIRKPNLRPL